MSSNKAKRASTRPGITNSDKRLSSQLASNAVPTSLPGRLNRATTIVALAFAAIIVAIGLYAATDKGSFPITLAQLPTMAECRERALKLLELKAAPSPELLEQLSQDCYSDIRSQGLLNDFEINKGINIQQYRANGVLLWMVVVITVSGVLLAGFQLLASYKLAEANRLSALSTTDEISLRRDRVVLRSSVTGLFILLISFAFFLVFVFYVYRIENPNQISSGSQVQTLPPGGLGPPPPQSKNQ